MGVIWVHPTGIWAGKFQSMSKINNVPGSRTIICPANTVAGAMFRDHSIDFAMLLHLKALIAGIRAMR